MHQDDIPVLLYFFKALADENRLRIIGLLGQQERSVGELAKLLGVTEPTVSHHLSKLHNAGILNLRQAGNQRFYRVNRERFEQTLQNAAALPEMRFDYASLPEHVSDDSWIDALDDFDDDQKKVLRDYTHNGRIRQLPRKQIKLIVILDWLSTKFDPERQYSEKEVNQVIRQYHEDFAGIRRDLVDLGYLRRERGGGRYWVAPQEEAPLAPDNS